MYDYTLDVLTIFNKHPATESAVPGRRSCGHVSYGTPIALAIRERLHLCGSESNRQICARQESLSRWRIGSRTKLRLEAAQSPGRRFPLSRPFGRGFFCKLLVLAIYDAFMRFFVRFFVRLYVRLYVCDVRLYVCAALRMRAMQATLLLRQSLFATRPALSLVPASHR